jgi:predicted nuclease of restriction endonuclease-like (RecB) superfamily
MTFMPSSNTRSTAASIVLVQTSVVPFPCKSPEEKQFYLVSAARSRWSHRELYRQIMSSAFECALL